MEKINKYGLGSNNRELVVTDKYGNVKSIFQNKITLTTLGSSGPSTFINNVLNIPNYSTALSGYVPTSRTLTINGTSYDLSANRTWSVGTVTGVTASAPLSSSGGTTPNITIPQANISTNGYLSATDWNTFNSKQPAGNYITVLSGEASGSGPGTASVTLNNASVTAKVLTGVNITGGSINASDSILTAFGKLQNQINGLIGSSIYQGTWNAATNTPALASGVGTRGYYYIVNVAGSTNLDGITDWNVGDWAIFDGTAWQQVDNTDSVTSVNGQTGAVSLTTDNIPEGVTNLYFTNLRSRQSISLTTLGTSGLSTYDNTTGVLNIPNYGSALSGYVPYVGATQNVNLGEYQLKAGQIEFDQTPTGTPGVAIMRWNDQDGTVDLGLKGGNVTLQIGQEQVTRVVNKTGINLLESNYQSVRISGAQGNRLKVALAQANNDANSAETLGIVTETINDNQEGFITTSGLVRNINTTGSIQGETWADGDMLYLSGTIAGQLTNIKPTAPIHTVIMGYVVRAHATQGQIYVKVDNGYELDELHNVAISSPLNNQGLFYETATQLWKNKSIDTALGYTPVPTTRTLTINGTSYDLSADRSWSVGTVTSVDMTVPTGLTVTGSPITGAGTLALGLQSGYSIPTTANQSNWTTAYNRSIVSAAVNYGVATTSLVLTQQNTGTVTASLIAGAASQGKFVFFNGTNLAYTSLNASAPLSFDLNTYTFSISQAGASTNGFLSSTDWNTFNNKQNAITLTTTGSSGPATLVGSTLNIPNYSSALSGYVPTSRQLTINGTSYDLSADRSWDVGTVTSIGVTAGPRIVSEDGPITSSGNITISHGIGQGLDVQGAQDLMNRSVEDGGSFEAFRCLATSLGELGDFETPLGTFNSIGTVVQNIMLDEFGHILGIGSKTLYTSDIIEDTNLYFTDARARAAISLTTTGTSGAATYNSSTGVLNIPQYQSVLTNPVTGTGTANYVARWTSSSQISIGVLYDNGTNVGIGTTSPGHKLQVLAPSNQQLGLYYDSSNYAAIGSRSNGDVQIYGYTSGVGYKNILLGVDGSSVGGNVGIGTTSPAARLTVVGDGSGAALVGQSGFGSNYTGISLNGTLNTGSYNLLSSSTDNNLYINRPSGNDIYFRMANSDQVTIKNSGLVGIGTTSPDSTLHVNTTGGAVGGIKLTSSTNTNGAAYLAQNAGGTSYFGRNNVTGGSFGGTAYSTVIYSSGTYPMEFYTNDAQRMCIASSGNVGIGTTGPTSTLTITDGATPYVGATGIMIDVKRNVSNGNDTTSRSGIRLGNNSNAFQIFYGGTTDRLRFIDGGNLEVLTLLNGGNVGIGTSSPSSKLEIRGAQSASKSSLLLLSKFDYGTTTFFQNYSNTFYANGKSLEIEVETLPMLQLATNNAATEGKVIFPNGNVGIGTSSPGDKLTVDGNINSKNTALFFGDGSDNSASIFATGGPVKFFANSSERMRITAAGDIGIGTTAPSYKLDVNGTGRFLGNASSSAAAIFNNPTGAGGTAQYYTEFTAGATVIGRIFRGNGASGVVGNGLNIDNFDGFQVRVNQLGGSGGSINLLGGRVGIGTTAPGYVLEVNGGSDTFVASFINSSASQSFIRVGDSSDLNYSGLALYSDSGSGQMFKNGTGSNSWGGNASLNIYNSNGSIAFHPNNTANAMFIATSGNVGIATTAPSQKLHVEGNVRVTGAYYDSNNQAGTSGQILSSTGSGTDWVDSPTATATSVSQLLPSATVTYNWVGSVVNDTWVDVFTRANNVLTTGVWMVTMFVSDWNQGGAHYSYRYSGTMTWYQDGTNQTGVSAASEIELHRMGHAANDSVLYLRTTEVSAASGGNGKLQIKGNYSNTSNTTITFTFVKIM